MTLPESVLAQPLAADTPLRAITLWRPWPYAILHQPPDIAKRVENRPWKPWASVIGKRVALHAGKKYDAAAELAMVVLETRVDVGDQRRFDQGIVGTALIKGWICNAHDYGGNINAHEAERAADSMWFFGPVGWVLDDVCALKTPIECSGAQGLWRLPDRVRHEIARQEREALHG